MTETLQVTSNGATHEQGAELLPRRRLSRRALMKAAGIAPFIALASRAWAQTTPKNLAAVEAIAPVPEAQLTLIRSEVEKSHPTLDLGKFDLVARALWAHFYYGLGNVCVDESNFPDGLLVFMFNEPLTGTQEKTGMRVATNIVAGNFDPFGNDYQTNVCAYVCGHKAATAALKGGKGVDSAIYRAARVETQTEMTAKFSAACKRAGGTSPTKKLGFGC